MLAFGQCVVRVHGDEKLNYFLKNYARAVGSGELGMDQCSITSFLSCLT